MRSEMCSLHLTHPSVHTWSSGQQTVRRPGSSRGLPAGVGIRTHNLGLPRVSSPTLYPLGQRLSKQCSHRFRPLHLLQPGHAPPGFEPTTCHVQAQRLNWVSHSEAQELLDLKRVTAIITSILLACSELENLLLGKILVNSELVSASDITPTDCWLNVWCIWHTNVETFQEFQSHHRIDWILQDFQEKRVWWSLTFYLETKMSWRQTPSCKKKAVVFTTVTMSISQDQLNARFSKVFELFYSNMSERYCGNISRLRNIMLNKMNCDWLFGMSVKWPHRQLLAN